MGVFTCRGARTRGPRGWITPLLAACLALAATHALAQDPTRLTIMVSGTAKMIYLPATLAQRLGYFRDEGLEVELLSQPAGVDAESELLTGFAQGVVGFYDHTIDLQAKGKEVRAIVIYRWFPRGCPPRWNRCAICAAARWA
jgi:NitT/TauT family transport system substrate-binding protein